MYNRIYIHVCESMCPVCTCTSVCLCVSVGCVCTYPCVCQHVSVCLLHPEEGVAQRGADTLTG